MRNEDINVFIQNLKDTTTVLQQLTVCIEGIKKCLGLIITYQAGDNIQIEGDVISATDTTYTAGANVQINGTVISATDTTYTAGDNVSIVNNVISATDTTYTAGANVEINGTVISATDTTYTAGTNVQINGNVISATDTTYTAGDNISIINNVIDVGNNVALKKYLHRILFKDNDNVSVGFNIITDNATPWTLNNMPVMTLVNIDVLACSNVINGFLHYISVNTSNEIQIRDESGNYITDFAGSQSIIDNVQVL